MILVIDTETSGKADFKSPFHAEHQPHLVQLGAQLIDNDYKVRGEIKLIVKPEGFDIPKEASDIHGITTAAAITYGLGLNYVMEMFAMLALKAHVFVAHNFQFDSLVLSTAFHRIGEEGGKWLEGHQLEFCTMHAMTDVCKLPGKYGSFKWPNLQEAYTHCFGEKFEGAHDAMADVRACAQIYRWILEQAKPPAVQQQAEITLKGGAA